MFATADASVQHVFISIKESITRVKVRWKLKYLLFSDLTKSMRSGYYWKLLFLFRMWLMWKDVYWKYIEYTEPCNRKGVRQLGIAPTVACYSF